MTEMEKQGLLTSGWDSKSVSLKGTEVFCEITHLTSSVRTTLTYFNQFDETLDARFVFPLEDVSVYSFEAHIADRVIIAECRPRTEAKETFDEAVKSGHTAFLAEQDEKAEDMFQISIGNVPPKESVKIILKYVGHLRLENVDDAGSIKSRVTFSLPSVINPRYTPQESKIEREFDPFHSVSAVTSSAYNLQFEASVFLPHPIASVLSNKDEFHMTLDSADPRRANVKLTSAFKSDHNLYMTMEMKEPLHSSAVCVLGDPSKSSILSMGCLMAHFVPDLADVVLEQESRTELVFVIDRSGSMSGSNIKHASESLLLFLKALPLGCRFQIIGFGNNHSKLFDAPVEYNEQMLERALDYQKSLEADMGGTNVLPALKAAYEAPLTGEGWYRQIIFITDGDVNNGSEVIGLVGANVNKARLFSVGIGGESASHLIATIARVGRGVAAFINSSSQLRSVVMKILGAALQPRANQVQIKWEVQDGGVSDKPSPIDVIQVPQTLAPVFHGHFLTVYGLLPSAIQSQPKGSIGLTCEILGKKQIFRVDLADTPLIKSTEDAPLHRLAGKRQMNELTDAHKIALMSDRSKDDPELTEIRQRVEKISCAINILCPITAMVGVDPVKREPVLKVAPQSNYDEPDSGAMRSFPVQQRARMMNCGSLRQMRSSGSSPDPELRSSPEVKLEGWLRLAELQGITGSWLWSKDVAEQMKFPDDVCGKSKPTTWPAPSAIPLDDLVWSTAIVVSFFETKLTADKDEWVLLVTKARAWLVQQAAKAHSADLSASKRFVQDLLTLAKQAVDKSEVK